MQSIPFPAFDVVKEFIDGIRLANNDDSRLCLGLVKDFGTEFYIGADKLDQALVGSGSGIVIEQIEHSVTIVLARPIQDLEKSAK